MDLSHHLTGGSSCLTCRFFLTAQQGLSDVLEGLDGAFLSTRQHNIKFDAHRSESTPCKFAFIDAALCQLWVRILILWVDRAANVAKDIVHGLAVAHYDQSHFSWLLL